MDKTRYAIGEYVMIGDTEDVGIVRKIDRVFEMRHNKNAETDTYYGIDMYTVESITTHRCEVYRPEQVSRLAGIQEKDYAI